MAPTKKDIASFRLGKNPPLRYYADVAIKFRDYTKKKALPVTPQTWAYGGMIDFHMYLNDTYPDCTCAAVGHQEQLFSTRVAHPETPSDANVWELFQRTGREEGLSNADGRYSEQVLGTWKNEGFQQTDGTLEKILGYAAVNPLDTAEVRAAGYMYGGLYIGIALPSSAQAQTGPPSSGKRWSCSGGTAPGSWGGHAVNVTAINGYGPVVATWGFKQQLTWCFWKTYVDEVYAVVSPDWIMASGKAPSGFDQKTLLDDLAQLS